MIEFMKEQDIKCPVCNRGCIRKRVCYFDTCDIRNYKIVKSGKMFADAFVCPKCGLIYKYDMYEQNEALHVIDSSKSKEIEYLIYIDNKGVRHTFYPKSDEELYSKMKELKGLGYFIDGPVQIIGDVVDVNG